MKRLVKGLVKHLVTCEYDRLFLVFLFLQWVTVRQRIPRLWLPWKQPVVESVKAEVSPDAGRRAEARVETKDVEGEMEVGGGGGEGSKEGLCL